MASPLISFTKLQMYEKVEEELVVLHVVGLYHDGRFFGKNVYHDAGFDRFEVFVKCPPIEMDGGPGVGTGQEGDFSQSF